MPSEPISDGFLSVTMSAHYFKTVRTFIGTNPSVRFTPKGKAIIRGKMESKLFMILKEIILEF
ncbi:hypothetical protein [Neisseria bergeri]|uniref:hypothetical protein n=1 Tax=Neisseria bergeri TaxID=1906581 RepID=UPI000D30E3E2|nr:hypothetical protein [Neisseria bergeri]